MCNKINENYVMFIHSNFQDGTGNCGTRRRLELSLNFVPELDLQFRNLGNSNFFVFLFWASIIHTLQSSHLSSFEIGVSVVYLVEESTKVVR